MRKLYKWRQYINSLTFIHIFLFLLLSVEVVYSCGLKGTSGKNTYSLLVQRDINKKGTVLQDTLNARYELWGIYRESRDNGLNCLPHCVRPQRGRDMLLQIRAHRRRCPEWTPPALKTTTRTTWATWWTRPAGAELWGMQRKWQMLRPSPLTPPLSDRHLHLSCCVWLKALSDPLGV